MTVRLVAVDEHVLLRLGLARVVASCTDIELVGEAGSAMDAMQVVAATQPDVAEAISQFVERTVFPCILRGSWLLRHPARVFLWPLEPTKTS